MKNPKTKTKIVHSKTKSAWNIISDDLGCKKYKIAIIPYYANDEHHQTSEFNRKEAYEHAEFISFCFNNSDKVLN